jgi:Protein of unknown function (DUF2892)
MANVGSRDRTIRIILGIVLLATPFLPPLAAFFAGWGAWKLVVAAAGAVMLGTALFRFCPLYTLLGMNTCGIRKS